MLTDHLRRSSYNAFAGLAGLAAAISIQSEDFQVTVLESTKELTEVGAGLQIVRRMQRLFEHPANTY